MKIGDTLYARQSTLKISVAKPNTTISKSDILTRQKEIGGQEVKPAGSYREIIDRQIADLRNSLMSNINGIY